MLIIVKWLQLIIEWSEGVSFTARVVKDKSLVVARVDSEWPARIQTRIK